MSARPRAALITGLVLTLAATWYTAYLETTDDSLLVEPRQPRSVSRTLISSPPPEAASSSPQGISDSSANDVRMRPSDKDLFTAHSWLPRSPPPPVFTPPPPQAPPLPFKYLGRMEENGSVLVFLTEGAVDERPRLVRQGDQVSNYRVDELTADGMSLTYLPLNQTQRMLFGNIN